MCEIIARNNEEVKKYADYAREQRTYAEYKINITNLFRFQIRINKYKINSYCKLKNLVNKKNVIEKK
ncbi:hypothetical protein HMPREF1250_0630 [Megasphaera vaginalis (ex Srinivasan et al. 2021)]|uniref:Uncharacterized protein n=1 Tax=Megasphaera vaginalis (ex Srinivasan et al. 2021) TaxID=1111454 RepID=U7UQ59_9FIRM|nr:hypothetical protein HMPREF1250_0630 [Megasphaera vaginalis (ex Srinivasan et al. 2021)]